MTSVAAAPVNVTMHLRRHAGESPARVAVRAQDGSEVTFEELERRSDAIARGLRAKGLGHGDRVSLFVHAGPDLIAVTHALFRLGAVPVLIDPGMGRKSLLSCVERMQPRALIAVPRAHVARLLFPRAFRSVELLVTVGRRVGWGGSTLGEVERYADEPFDAHPTSADDEAAILFTSGSTGPPKGVTYTHGNFEAQLVALRDLYDLRPGEVDVACFPLFALFDNALGMTSVFPAMDPSRPGTCDPAKIVAAIEESGATFAFGSPAIWRRVLPWMRREVRRFRTLRRLTIAGAPVPPQLAQGLRDLLPEGGDVHTPYGATESLPVASISGAEIAALRPRVEGGAGNCVGRPAPGAEVRIIAITDEPLARLSDARELAPGEHGEICVRGAVVTHEYKHEPGATALAKMHGPDGEVWHRMGDVGYVDAEGRLWFCGRKSHRLETTAGPLFPVPIENLFLDLPGVHRAAVVGVGPRGSERPVLIIEPEPDARRADVLARVEARRAERGAAAPIEAVLFHGSFPVDVRHNAKIHRLALKAWAERKLA
ncbi:MAG: fatty acid CoA ligase family protein [Planctomycetota bacterium]